LTSSTISAYLGDSYIIIGCLAVTLVISSFFLIDHVIEWTYSRAYRFFPGRYSRPKAV